MRIFCLLFSILILTLSVLPCGDTVECKDNTKTEITNHNDHENHNHNSEQCPPFCSCACCGVQIANFENQSITFKENTPFSYQKEKINGYKSILTSNFYGSIWQPPQIA